MDGMTIIKEYDDFIEVFLFVFLITEAINIITNIIAAKIENSNIVEDKLPKIIALTIIIVLFSILIGFLYKTNKYDVIFDDSITITNVIENGYRIVDHKDCKIFTIIKDDTFNKINKKEIEDNNTG